MMQRMLNPFTAILAAILAIGALLSGMPAQSAPEADPPEADLVVLASAPQQIPAGTEFSYSFTIRNNGPDVATGVILRDFLPNNIALREAMPSQGSCSAANGPPTCALGTVPVSGTATITLRVFAFAGLPALRVNTAHVAANQFDPDPSNNSPESLTLVLAGADLSLTATASSLSLIANSEVQHTFTVRNNGPISATDTILTIEVPPELYAVSGPRICNLQNIPITCALGTLNNGAQQQVTLTIAPESGASRSFGINARVGAATADPDRQNNVAEQQIRLNPASLRLLFNLLLPAAPEAMLNSQLTLTNDGPAPATTVTLFGNAPPGTTIASITPSKGNCTNQTTSVHCIFDTLAVSETVTINLALNAPDGASVYGFGDFAVGADQYDPEPEDNAPIFQVQLNTADLAMSGRASAENALPGAQLTYVFTTTNTGPSTATGVQVQLELSPGALLNTSSASQGNCAANGQIVTCTLGSLANGASATITLGLTANATENGTIVTLGYGTATQLDPDASNNSPIVATTLDVQKAFTPLMVRPAQ